MKERFKVIDCLGVNKAGNQQFKYSCPNCGREYIKGYYFRRNGICYCMKSKKKKAIKKAKIEKAQEQEKKQDIKQPRKPRKGKFTPCNLDTTPRQLRGLLAGVLFSAIKDARKATYHSDILYFLNTDYCQEICDFCNISYEGYKNRVLKEIARYQKRS